MIYTPILIDNFLNFLLPGADFLVAGIHGVCFCSNLNSSENSIEDMIIVVYHKDIARECH